MGEMGKFLKKGKIVIITHGRHAGKKAVVVEVNEGGNDDECKFPNVLVAGIARYPRRVGRKMSKKKINKRIQSMKCFVKYYNVNHVMNTRYTTSGGSQGGSLDVKAIFK